MSSFVPSIFKMIYILFFFIALLTIIFTLIYSFQEKLIFQNGKKLEKNYQYQFSNKFEEIFLTTKDEKKINALHFKTENPKGVLLFCHGNNGNLTKWGKRISYLLKYNYDVFVFDYRNYGKSSGNFNEEKMFTDALLVYKHIKRTVKEDKIVVYGFSLGGTFATRIAAQNKPKELILEAPFYSFKKAVQYYSILAPTFLLKYQFKTNRDIVKVTAPITVFHGNKDKITSFKDAKKLLALNRSRQNCFIEIENGTHHNSREHNLYKQKLKEILER
ncbi:alpha/beta fold hydrolase [uncultured Polaribacter sp.]|uniref:alpha/beta hydrolase n=1 Tax=uncultured Polaribacter sp. TaxID=174711 RepID=UPI00260CF9C5|nr:alpha/beta fold hydrolase [uncultured Polaribacter sp.]